MSRRKVHRKKVVNEYPAAVLTIEQLIAELNSRPDFSGAVAWRPHVGGSDWRWQSNNCAAGVVFLQMANHIICQSVQPPPAAQAPSQPQS